MAHLSVHHFVVNKVTRQHGSTTTHDLLGVDYRYRFPADTEFPGTILRLDLFARFFVSNIRSTTFKVIVKWLDIPGRQAVLAHRSPTFRVTFPPGIEVMDQVFRLANMQLPGSGRYVFRLFLRQGNRLNRRWLLLGTEYMSVEK
jgi:hypothetical protein